MFSSPSSAIESQNYDFEKAENAAKWKGVFVNSLRKVSNANTMIKLSHIITRLKILFLTSYN